MCWPLDRSVLAGGVLHSQLARSGNFFAPAASVEWVDNWNVIGLTATNSGGFKCENLFVPDGYSMNREHLSEVRLPDPLYLFPLNALFAIGFSAVALGVARSMLDAAVALAREKRPW